MKIKLLGGAREVGGSCIAVESEYCNVALDYGVKVEERSIELPKSFDAIVISHAHLDHTGNLLSLSGTDPVIVGSKITRDVTVDLLNDMVKIQSQKGVIFYDEFDVRKLGSCWWTRDCAALPGMNITLYPAGHVAGAKITSIACEGKSIVYTGDFCLHDSEILKGCNVDLLPKEPDVLITESTYGGKVRLPRSELIDQFFELMLRTMARKGNVLIPTFAFHRSQEMAKRIDQAMVDGILPHYNVYTISNLAHKINGYFNEYKELFTEQVQHQERPFEFKYVKPIRSTRQIVEPAVVICTSGFGHAGASLRLLLDWAEGEENSIILTSGYLPPDSPLKQAKDDRSFTYEDKTITVNAEVKQIELSGHADQVELIELINTLRPKQTVLVHGDLEQAQALSEKISTITEVCIPEKDDVIDIT
jgi:Cft2 family RNA processing exonuclease